MCLASDPVSSALLNVTWLLNASIVVLSGFLLYHWSTMTWILGSAAYSTLLEIIALAFMLYVLLGGVVMLGSYKQVRSAYLHLHRSKSCHGIMLLVPLLAFGFFLTLSLLALVRTSITTTYLKTHTQKVFEKADTNGDNAIDNFEFQNYILSLPAFQNSNTSDFCSRMLTVFDTLDALDSKTDDSLTEADIYNAAYSSLDRPREIFGVCAAVLCGVILLLSLIWAVWYTRLRKEIRSRGRLGGSGSTGRTTGKGRSRKKGHGNLVGSVKPKRKLKKRSNKLPLSSSGPELSESQPEISRAASSTVSVLHSRAPSTLTLRHGELDELLEPENTTNAGGTLVDMPTDEPELSRNSHSQISGAAHDDGDDAPDTEQRRPLLSTFDR